ncbi:MAG TPA: amidohydrolase [Rhodobacteraceae bacterium]|nr:amidohydrolase [Paracoccaceae bacterium]
MSKITVFTAKRIHTMCDSAPYATAVAVRDGNILEAGTLESLKPWLEGADYIIDERFDDKTIMPGFIDPHLHPFIGAILLPTTFITALEWNLPDRRVPATIGRKAYLLALKENFAKDDGALPLFVTWGYHQLWHGEITRSDLNNVSASRPIMVWHRSFHEFILNDAAIELLDISQEVMYRHPQIDAERGRFYETGAMAAIAALKPFLFSESWFGRGLQQLHRVLQHGGHTTVADMAWGIFDFEMEWAALVRSMDTDVPPYRCMLIPTGIPHLDVSVDPEATFAQVKSLCERGTKALFFDDHVKFFADGALFSELFQLEPPGFIDGHEGEWMTPPHALIDAMRPYWNAGWKIHIHCTGNLGLELALDALAALQFERPRFDHRFTIEHFGTSTEEQVARIKALGAIVSANIWYLHELGEVFANTSIGYERASQMVRLGSLARANVPFALHSDYTMAPAEPLVAAWVAVNRVTQSGAVFCENERVSVHQAMQAITINAAIMLGQENRIGSIRAGKKADFTVLDEDPYKVDPMLLKDIRIHATVFEGVVHTLDP